MSTDLATIENINALEVFTDDGIDPVLESIAKEVRAFVPDMSTEQGRKDIASMAYKVARSKTTLDNMGKELTAEWKQRAKLVDNSRKKLRDFLDSLRDEVRQPLNEWEEKEKQRILDHENNVTGIIDLGQSAVDGYESMHMAELLSIREQIESIEISEKWQEFEMKAMQAKKQALINANHAINQREIIDKRIEEEKAEAERLRIENEKRIAEEAAEAARIEAERKAAEAREAAERAEAERIAAIEAEKQAAIREREQAEKRAREAAEAERRRAEQEKIEAVKAEREKHEQAELERKQREEAERKKAEKAAANKAHQKRINNEALESMVSNDVSEDMAKTIITLIASGKIKNISINY